MTPKEKAQELVDKFYKSLQDTDCVYRDADCSIYYEHTFVGAKEIAIIAVDEILSTLGNEVTFVFTDFNWVLYWEQVKKEIEAL